MIGRTQVRIPGPVAHGDRPGEAGKGVRPRPGDHGAVGGVQGGEMGWMGLGGAGLWESRLLTLVCGLADREAMRFVMPEESTPPKLESARI